MERERPSGRAKRAVQHVDKWQARLRERARVRKTEQTACRAGLREDPGTLGVMWGGAVTRRPARGRGTGRPVGLFVREVAHKTPNTHRRRRILVNRWRPGGVVRKHALGGEFDPGSGSTLAACLMHASRTGSPSGGSRGGRVRNAWGSCRAHGGSHRKRWVIPDTLADRVG